VRIRFHCNATTSMQPIPVLDPFESSTSGRLAVIEPIEDYVRQDQND
jgi:hypothetical protein